MVTISLRQRRALLWAVLAGGFLLVNFHRTATAVLAETLAATFDATGAELGSLHASFFYIYAALQLPSGLVVDRYGSRRVGAVGLVAMTAGVVWFASSGSLAEAFIARAAIGLGGSVCYIATLRFCANWYRPDEYATMTGYTIAAAGVGGILATTPLALAIEAVGWRSALLVAGGVGAAIAVTIGVVVRDTPTDAGHGPIKGVAAPDDTATLTEVVANTRAVLAERETWLLGGVLFLTLGANFTVLGLWGVPYIVDIYDVSVATASTYVLLGNVGFVVGSPAFGALSDRLARRTGLMIGAAALFTLSYAALALVPPLPVVGAALFLALFANGGVALAFTVGKERHDTDVAGTITGVINSMGYFGAALFPTLLGAVLDAYWTGEVINGARVYTVTGYRVAFGVATLAGVLATGATVWLHHRHRRRAPGSKAVAADD
jgi:sugar phosphate permease